MNWGHKLIIVFIAFGAMIGYMVYRCSGVHVNLVSVNYYQEELAYQKVIDGKANASRLSDSVQILQSGNRVIVQLPTAMKNQLVEGDIKFYCANIPGNDRNVPLQTNSDGRQVLDAGVIKPGLYAAKISWLANQVNYFTETLIAIR